MGESAPAWLRVVLRAERTVGARLESAVHSDAYFDLLAHGNRGRARAVDVVEGVSKRVLHLVNLPAGTDIRNVREQLTRMERRLIEVTKELDELSREREWERNHARPDAVSEHGLG